MSSSPENHEGQMGMFSSPGAQQEPRPTMIETPLQQDLLEYYKRQAEFYERFQLGQKKYNILTLIKADEPSNRAVNGSSGVQYALSRGGRSPEDIRRAADRFRSETGRLALKFSDLAAESTMNAYFRTEIGKLSISEVQKNAEIETKKMQVKHLIGYEMLSEFKGRFITSSASAENRKKAEKNLKEGIKLQVEMRSKIQTDKLGVNRPQFFHRDPTA